VQNRDGGKLNRRRGTSSASNVLHRMSLPVGNWLGGKTGEKKVVEFKDLHSTKPHIVSPQTPNPVEVLQPNIETKNQIHIEMMNPIAQQIEDENREYQQQRKRRSKCCFFTICS